MIRAARGGPGLGRSCGGRASAWLRGRPAAWAGGGRAGGWQRGATSLPCSLLCLEGSARSVGIMQEENKARKKARRPSYPPVGEGEEEERDDDEGRSNHLLQA